MRALLKREVQYERKIATVLRKALDEIRVDMVKVYEKYATDGILTTADMSRYMRYSAMEKDILSKLDPAIKKSMETIKRVPPEQYNAAFFHTAWVVDSATQTALNWGIINTKAIHAAYAITDPANKNMAEALRNYSMKSRASIRRAINDGLAQGKAFTKMAADVKNAVNKIHSSAITIVRTEGMSAINAGTMDAYDRALEQGVEGVIVWQATLDLRTRDLHRDMDGRTRDKDGYFHLPNGEKCPYPTWEGLSAGQRINCRCGTRIEIEGYSPQLRRTREGGIVDYQVYRDWELTHGPKVH